MQQLAPAALLAAVLLLVWPPVAVPAEAEGIVVTQHAITVDGERIEYTATAGHLLSSGAAGKPDAKIFFVSYARTNGDPQRPRPVTFAFNGGPGASSMWLHLGIGPKRVEITVDERGRARPGPLIANEATWLDFTDLVFVDPVGTGYSRAARGVDERDFFEVKRDVEVAAAFVQAWLTRYQRGQSPRFIAGESYGSTRAALLARRLQESAGIDVDGLMLISSVLDFQTVAFQPPNDLAFALALPTYAATAWHHGKLAGDLQARMRETERWALDEYLPALEQGDGLAEADRGRIAQRLTQYTGIDEDELVKRRLRIAPAGFSLHLLRETGRMTGRLDSRVTAPDTYRGVRRGDYDPSFYPFIGALGEALNGYLRRDLQYRTTLRYEHLSREANRGWKWGSHDGGYLSVANDLAAAMARHPGLRVMVAAGYYDLATPYLAQKYSVERMALDPPLRSNVRFAGYPAGHQIYDDPASAAMLRADAAKLVRCATERICDEPTMARAPWRGGP